uniref:Ig-like domain-containing protein n=1 Tax=Myripristis murdjan TaxID=586833 RepID=A0A667Y760_9TELE
HSLSHIHSHTNIHTDIEILLMYGCEWDDETGDTYGFDHHGYDGEDFVVFELETKTWIAPTPQAVFTKHMWDRETGRNEIVPPDSSVTMEETPSSPVTCHASGFYPNKIMLFWTRDGEVLHEDVDHGEILHNHDGTFQKSVDLHLSSVKAEDWGRYSCVFQLSGVKEDIVTKLDPKGKWRKNVFALLVCFCFCCNIFVCPVQLGFYFIYLDILFYGKF